MDIFLTIFGIVFLLVSLAGVMIGIFVATDRRMRESGLFFALWWVPAVATSVGILLRDPVTSLVGVLCFVVAGAALFLGARAEPRTPAATRRRSAESDRTTRERIRTGERRKSA